METTFKFPTPPWDMDTAAARLTLEEAAWNTHDPEEILQGYTDNVEMRDGTTFVNSKDEFKAFLTRKFAEQQSYRLKLDLWGALKGRMAVRFEAEWQDGSGRHYKSFGVQVLQFNETGLAEKRFASQETTSLDSQD